MEVSKENGTVAFGHLPPSERSALLSLTPRDCTSSATDECLWLVECDKCSTVNDDDNDVESASCESVPGVIE